MPGHLLRNYKLYGHPLSTEGEHYLNTDMSAAALIANLARNSALHLATKFGRINRYMEGAMQAALGSQFNNPKTTWGDTPFRIHYSLNEDQTGNFIHMIIALFSLISLPILWYQGKHRSVLWYAIATMLGAVFYCWILKWQPWASRLHMPFFAMAAPLLAITITLGLCGIWKHVGHVIVLCMVFYSLIFVCYNSSRRLASLNWYHKNRIELYFSNRKSLFLSYEKAINVVREAGVQEVGLYLGANDCEYQFWALAMGTKEDKRAIIFRARRGVQYFKDH